MADLNDLAEKIMIAGGFLAIASLAGLLLALGLPLKGRK